MSKSFSIPEASSVKLSAVSASVVNLRQPGRGEFTTETLNTPRFTEFYVST